ncbi:SPOR domain-containing protein [Viscerimonas tarda]
MKQYGCLLLFFLFIGSNICAQKTIITDLNTTKVGQGSVNIYEDGSISGLIGHKPSSNEGPINQEVHNTEVTTPDSTLVRTTYKEVTGYKIQVFSGNDQRNSKREGESRKSLMQNAFPDMEVNLTVNPPVWRLRAGNFRTYEEAFQALNDLKNAFPSFAREMQIVKALVRLPIY